MTQPLESPSLHAEDHRAHTLTEQEREQILFELENILAGPSFRGSARSKQFLRYVVRHQLEGHPEHLKERTIGIEVFQRQPGYATGDDPVVRVQASEVRRRLDQYYKNGSNGSSVRIDLPLGSYSPSFHWPVDPAPIPKRTRRTWIWRAGAAAVVIAAGIGFWRVARTVTPHSDFDQFWDPLFATQQPALICLAKGVTYRPGPELYRRYQGAHPGTFQTEVERYSEPLPLNSKEKLSWGDLQLLDGYGVALGDVSAAVKFSTLLGKLGKPNQLRIGANYSYADLRNSPAIVIGAFNNRWTMDLLSAQHFAFTVNNGQYAISEQVPGHRSWTSQFRDSGTAVEDVAIVARLLDSKTGQFTVIAAGLRDSGTESAGEFASNPKYLEEVLRTAPAGWQTKNMEVVVKTTIIDSIPGPPQPVATYFW